MALNNNIEEYTKTNPEGSKGGGGKTKGSILQMYSLGYAAANLQVGQTELSVFPSEARTYADGEITDNVSEVSTKGVDGNGGNYSDTVQVGNAIKAKWLSRSGWLKTPGLVRRGEQVMIWRVGDTDQYYWELTGTTNHLRRTDVMLIVLSNTKDESVTELTQENSYFIEFNTMDKHLTLQTNKNNGEAAAYVMQLNTGDGFFHLGDDVGNNVLLNSVENLIKLLNADATEVTLDKTKLLLKATDEVKIQSKSFIGQCEEVEWTGQTWVNNYASGTNNISGTTTFNGGAINYQGTSITHDGKSIDSSHKHNGVKGGSETSGTVA